LENVPKELNIKDEYINLKIPSDLMEVIKNIIGDDYLWNYNEDTNQFFIIKRPKSITEALYGLGAEMWKKAGGTDYIRQEREEWDS
jgi:hypothetical protein